MKPATESERAAAAATYVPAPIDTSGVVLHVELAALTELLSESTHDNWAAQRMRDGWTYGPERDDAKKLHPGLIPYGMLTDSEKEYDRRTALETLKAIICLGYTIEKAA